MKTKPFLEDIYPQNLFYAVTIRSPIAKGQLRMIKVPKLPDNYAIITARNIPGENRLEETDMPILAEKTISYIGEPVALLLGHDKTNLEDLAAQCEIIADEEKPLFKCNEPGTKIIAAKREINIGDAMEMFRNTGKIVSGSYITGIQDHWYAEPSGAVTWFSEKESDRKKKASKQPKSAKKNAAASHYAEPQTLIIKTATQWPSHVKQSVARVLAIDPSFLSVETTALSLHMDGKLWFPSLISCHAALATYITKKPVRLILNREEDFLYSPKRCGTNIDISSAIDENGNISASVIDINVNLGAYGVNSEEILDQVCLGAISCYSTNSLKLNAKAMITNLPPQGPFSGFGISQGNFATERHVSLIADTVNADPALWRQNVFKYNLVSCNDLITEAAKISDYHRKWSSYEMLRKNRKSKTAETNENPRGIGIATGFQGNGLLYGSNKDDNTKGACTVEVTLTKESILEIKTSISSSEDYNKIWEKVVMETMSIKPEKVRIIYDNAPDCGPSCASRNITVITKLVEKCCLAIRKQRRQQRANDSLPITVRRTAKPQSGELWGGLFPAQEGLTMDISGFAKLGRACAVVEVFVDLIECIPKIRGVWLLVDAGKIISKNRAKRSLIINTVQALGWSFTEYIEYENGRLPRHQYDNFAIPSPADIPPIHIDFYTNDDKEPRGIGELPFTCIPAAFLQAVSQAMDHSFKSIPLRRKEIWEMIRIRQ